MYDTTVEYGNNFYVKVSDLRIAYPEEFKVTVCDVPLFNGMVKVGFTGTCYVRVEALREIEEES